MLTCSVVCAPLSENSNLLGGRSAMRRLTLIFVVILSVCCVLSAQDAAKPAGLPTDGYNVHVLAPHLVDGKQMGPYHHYCKVLAPDPQIVCLIYESTDPNAR